jgi:hypothetical protein
MSLLKKLLGLGDTPKKEKPFINRAHRVHISLLHNLHYLPKTPPFYDKVKIGNISLSGLGLYVKDIASAPKANTHIQGKLSVEGVEIQVELLVKQKVGDLLGCSFKAPDNDLISFLRNYFEVELEVFSLQVNNPTVSENLERYHLVGSPLCELWWESPIPSAGALSFFRMSFFGNYLEGGTGQKVRYGNWTAGPKNLNQISENIHPHVHWESFFPETDKEKALKVISYAPGLSSEERKFLRAEIKRFK